MSKEIAYKLNLSIYTVSNHRKNILAKLNVNHVIEAINLAESLGMMKVQYARTVTTAERNLLKKEMKKMFAANNDIQVYTDFFEWMGKPERFKMRKNRTLEYADLAPLAYLHIALAGNSNTPNSVKHLLIDEMQDYSPIQYKAIQKLFSCRKTVLADASQSVNPYTKTTPR